MSVLTLDLFTFKNLIKQHNLIEEVDYKRRIIYNQKESVLCGKTGERAFHVFYNMSKFWYSECLTRRFSSLEECQNYINSNGNIAFGVSTHFAAIDAMAKYIKNKRET